MIDAESAIYSTISGVFKEHYPNGSQYGEEVDSPAKFPCMVLIESDNYTHEESLDSEMPGTQCQPDVYAGYLQQQDKRRKAGM